MKIDTAFDVYSDTPTGRDPDSHSKTLRRYHRYLWSKPLPDGSPFELALGHPRAYLRHRSEKGDFVLSSDSIGHTYRHVESMAAVVELIPPGEIDAFFATCSTVGAYIVFPSNRIDGKPTLNGARGLNGQIRDRFDLTLECVRRHYAGLPSPLTAVFARYADFFNLFSDFRGYTDFFLLQDMTSHDRSNVRFFTPFQGFDSHPLWSTTKDYRKYMMALIEFIVARNGRIDEFSSHPR